MNKLEFLYLLQILVISSSDLHHHGQPVQFVRVSYIVNIIRSYKGNEVIICKSYSMKINKKKTEVTVCSKILNILI
jgi:hypothetical protein